MATLFNSYTPSGTFSFFPSNLEVVAQAFSRVRIKRTEIEPSHLQDALSELNFFLAAFNNVGPNLAQVDLQTVSLVKGTATYTLLTETVMVLDVYVTLTSGPPDTYLYSISRTEYAAIPDKTVQGRPTQYWYDRLQAPTVSLFPVPDQAYTLSYYRFRQVQDATLANGVTPEVPNRALDAIVAGLAYRLSRIYAPDLEDKRKLDAAEAWAVYAKQDTEDVPLMITPGLSGYYRV